MQSITPEQHLSHDPVIKSLINQYHLSPLEESTNLYLDLVNIIISQQLSVKAAKSITNRLHHLLNYKSSAKVTPHRLLKLSAEQLRSVGLSQPKITYIHHLSQSVIDNQIIIDQLKKASDESVFEQITKLKGLGPWSADMFLIFSLQRPDIFSIHDLGLRTAVSRLYHLDRQDFDAINHLSQKWSPYRSLASRYLWASLDNSPI